MKHKHLPILIIAVFLLTAISPWVFTKSGGGPAQRTGAPINANTNELTCAACHGGSVAQNAPQLSITIDGNPTEYVPGQTYSITVTNNAQANMRGFQLVAIDETFANAGSFTAGANTRIITGGGRSYICHNNANQSSWTFSWTAPANPVGKISFYAITRSVGVGIFANSFGLDAPVTSLNSAVQLNDIKIYPNPATQFVKVSGKAASSQTFKIDLVSLSGQIVLEHSVTAAADGQFSTQIDLSTVKGKGLYLLRYINAGRYEIKKLQII
jgi:cytochrome c553